MFGAVDYRIDRPMVASAVPRLKKTRSPVLRPRSRLIVRMPCPLPADF